MKQLSLEEIVNINYSTEDVELVHKNGRTVLRNKLGHNSFFLKKPIIQGKFYIEMIGHKPSQTLHSFKEGPNFRVGVVPTEYYYNYPLGQLQSVAYKSNGTILSNRQKIAKLAQYTFGDTIGIAITVVDVYKDRDRGRRAPNNSVAFYKNGLKISEELHILSEDLYSFAGSIYNGSEIEALF